LRYRCTDDRGGGEKTAEAVKVVLGKPDRVETELFRISGLFNNYS